MLEQRQRRQQQYQSVPIVLDQAQQLLLTLTGKMVLEEVHQVS
jgi:hypothetical protein